MKLKVDHTRTICCTCKSNETYISTSGRPKWYICRCKGDSCTGYLCNKCNIKCWYNDTIKPMRTYSIDKISIYENNGMGLLGECVIAKYFGIRNCTNCDILKSYGNNYKNSCDFLLTDENGNLRIQVKTRTPKYGEWRVSSRLSEAINFDILYVLCMSKSLEKLEKLYAIPEKEFLDKSAFNIRRNPTVMSWFEKYRIDEKQFGDCLSYILSNLEFCPILKK